MPIIKQSTSGDSHHEQGTGTEGDAEHVPTFEGQIEGDPSNGGEVEADEDFKNGDGHDDLFGMTAAELQAEMERATTAAKHYAEAYAEAEEGSDEQTYALGASRVQKARAHACKAELDRRERNRLRAERRAKSQTSERTGKPKKKPRGKPFKRGTDQRRSQTEGDGEGDGEGEDEGEDEGDEGDEGDTGDNGGTEGTDKMPRDLPDNPEESPIDQHIRRIARSEDARGAEVIDRNFGIVMDEIARVEALAVKGGNGRGSGGIVTVKINGVPSGQVEGQTHPAFTEVLKAQLLGLNVLLVGPAGCGKTTLAAQTAKATGRDFAAISCSAGMTESALTGRLLPTGEGGRFEYVGTEFVRLYEQGGTFLLDEVDAADANVILVLNSAIGGNDYLPLPARYNNPVAKRHPKFVLIAAANTYGHGANRVYVGRNQLDGATVDRFAGGVFDMDYDRTLEAALVTDADALLAEYWRIRDKINSAGMRRVWGTRGLIAAYKWHKGAGYSVADAIKRQLVGWSPDELNKIGVKP